MHHRALLLTLFVAVVLAITAVPVAAAPSLAPPVPGAVLLGFGSPYGTRVHSGLDLEAPVGASVAAAAEGSVTFAGRLPFDGANVLGVTITTADGFKVTCLPLTTVAVAKGDTVRPGEPLGTLASEGDASSAAVHLHVSVRDGESYLDPAELIVSPPDPAPEESAPAPAVEAATDRAQSEVFPPAPPATAPSAAGPVVVPGAPAAAAQAPDPALSFTEAPASTAQACADGVGDVPVASARGEEAGGVASPQLSPSAAGARTGPAAGVVPNATRALAHRHAPAPARPACPPPPLSLRALASGVSRLRSLATALAALIVSAALLWPAWRRMSALEPAAEPAPARIRT